MAAIFPSLAATRRACTTSSPNATTLWWICAAPMAMSIPDTLRYKIKRHGRLATEGMELFGSQSWLAVHIGQHNWPERHDPLVDLRPMDGAEVLERQRHAMAQAAEAMPTHAEFIRRHCDSGVPLADQQRAMSAGS